MAGLEERRSRRAQRSVPVMLTAFLLYLPFVTLGSRLTAWKPSSNWTT
jgi:hypothetical protein